MKDRYGQFCIHSSWVHWGDEVLPARIMPVFKDMFIVRAELLPWHGYEYRAISPLFDEQGVGHPPQQYFIKVKLSPMLEITDIMAEKDGGERVAREMKVLPSGVVVPVDEWFHLNDHYRR